MEKNLKSGGKIEISEYKGKLLHIQARFRNICYKIGNIILDKRGNTHTIKSIESTIGDDDVLFCCEKGKLILLLDVVGKICPGEVVNIEKRIVKWNQKYNGMAASKTVKKIDKLTEIKDIIEGDVEALRIQGLLKKRKETLEEFLIKFFSKWNEEKDTILVENKEVDTLAGCRRSIGDVYMICKYYYPKCTLKEVKDILYGFIGGSKLKGFRSSYCHSTDKRMFYREDPEDKSVILNTDEVDEFGMITEDWNKL